MLRERGAKALREALHDPRADITAKLMGDLAGAQNPDRRQTAKTSDSLSGARLPDAQPGEDKAVKLPASDVLGGVEIGDNEPLARAKPRTILVHTTRKTRGATSIDLLPTIRLEAGDIETIVDQVVDALIKAKRGLYQRGGLIVSVGHAPALAAHGRDVVVQRIAERGDHALLEDICAAARFERYDARVSTAV